MMTSAAREFRQLVRSVGDDQLAARPGCRIRRSCTGESPSLSGCLARGRSPQGAIAHRNARADLTGGVGRRHWKTKSTPLPTRSAPAPGNAAHRRVAAKCPPCSSVEWCSVSSWCTAGIWRKRPGGHGNAIRMSRPRPTRRQWVRRTRRGKGTSSARRSPFRPPAPVLDPFVRRRRPRPFLDALRRSSG